MLSLSNLEKILNTKPTRRGFLLTLGLAGCAGAFGSHIKAGYNPNFNGPGQLFMPFAQSYGWTPGMGWKVRNPTPIYASALGVIHDARKPKQMAGHAGGYHVILKHSDNLKDSSNFTPGFYSRYYHLNRITRKNGIVERGEIIGYAGDHYNVFGLAFKEHGNYVNPDDWGPSHGYMDYWDGKTNLETTGIIDKTRRQIKLMMQMHSHYKGSDRDRVLNRVWISGYYGVCSWSMV